MVSIMKPIKRFYDTVLSEHVTTQRQMAFVSGPRQVGKTTTCRSLSHAYFNWDNTDDRSQIVKGPAFIAEQLELGKLHKNPPVALFDELHKFKRWKQFLKGFFDTYADRLHIIVTGSSRMDVYRRGGDSLMGRYFLYRMHPLSIAEILAQEVPDAKEIIRQPKPIPNREFSALWEHGGYPEPFLKRDPRFSRRWQSLRRQQLLREDIRDLTQIQQLDQLELLVNILSSQSARQITYSTLSSQIQITIDTVRRWIYTLCNLHLGFLVRPWYKNVSRSLRKEPKWFLRDWSLIEDPGARAETLIACHLLKAVEGWTDLGLGEFHLGYLRDKEQKEVDFIVTQDGKPWFLVEAKSADTKISPALRYYQNQLKVPLAFQVVLDTDYVDASCFQSPGSPLIVPARTFLSQLL